MIARALGLATLSAAFLVAGVGQATSGAAPVASPELHAAWWFRIARAYVRSRELSKARNAMQRSVATYPRRLRRWPLLVASLISDGAFSAGLRAYLGAARCANRRGQASDRPLPTE